jgi:hypothetical protein
MTILVQSKRAPRGGFAHRAAQALHGWRSLASLARKLDGLSATEARRLLEERGMICRAEAVPASEAADVPISAPPGFAVRVAGEPRRPASASLQAHLWPMYRRVGRQSQLFGEMLERVEVDPTRPARLGMAGGLSAAARRCLTCTRSDACQDWLARTERGAAPSFCPNASFLNSLRDTAGAIARA